MFKLVVVVALLVLVSPSSFAGKIVVFDHEQALLRTQAAQKKIEQLKSKPEYTQMIAQVESLRADLEALSKEESSKGMTWGADEKAEHRKKMEQAQIDFRRAAQKIQAENSAVFGALVEEMQPKLEEVLNKLMQSEGIDMVVKKQAAYIARPDSDITLKITEELDKLK